MSGYRVYLYLHFPICLHGVHRNNFNLIVTRNSAATVSKGIVKCKIETAGENVSKLELSLLMKNYHPDF